MWTNVQIYTLEDDELCVPETNGGQIQQCSNPNQIQIRSDVQIQIQIKSSG